MANKITKIVLNGEEYYIREYVEEQSEEDEGE